MNRVFESTSGSAYLEVGRFPDQEMLERCVADVVAEGRLEFKPAIVVRGMERHQQRNVGFFSDTSTGYKYSGRRMCAKPLGPELAAMVDCVNVCTGARYNGILVNQYIDGNNYISAHPDNESELDPIGVVAVSWGAERRFVIRDRATKQVVFELPTEHGGMILMGGDFQSHYTHGIPVQKKIKNERVSFTFRKHNV